MTYINISVENMLAKAVSVLRYTVSKHVNYSNFNKISLIAWKIGFHVFYNLQSQSYLAA